METLTLGSFIQHHRDAIVATWAERVKEEILRTSLSHEQLLDELHSFLAELVQALEHANGDLARSGRSAVAREHGRQRHGLRHHISEVVREYGVLFDCILDLACRDGAALPPEDVRKLSRFLCAGAAEAVDEFAEKSQGAQRRADFESFAFLAHEIRTPLSTALLSWELLAAEGAHRGASAERHGRSLQRLSELVDHSLTHSRLMTVCEGAPLRRERIQLAELLQDVVEESALQAAHKQICLAIDVPSSATADADPRLLRSALSNLVRNAVKFTQRGKSILLRGCSCHGHARIEVEDGCGGLPGESADQLFRSFAQAGRERSGFGLGLAIAQQAVLAHGGKLQVQARKGEGCMFTIDLPPEPASAQEAARGRGNTSA